MIGVLIPQVPLEMRDNPAGRAVWLELRREDYGPFTELMDRFDLFEIFRSPWFVALWLVIIVAVTVCTVSRLRPTWRNVERPSLRVADGYFETARHRAACTHEGGRDAVTKLLRRKRFRVSEVSGDDAEAVYLFADRFPWTQYGTFLSHLALLLLLVGGVLTAVTGFSRTVALAEGRPGAPVLDQPGSGQLFVSMIDAHQGTDSDGNIIDFHSDLLISQGSASKTCTATVNGPCEAFGYRFHQAAFFDDLALLTVRDEDGRVIFDDVLDFNNETAIVPRVKVTGADGAALFDQDIPQMASVSPEAVGLNLDDEDLGFGVAFAELQLRVSDTKAAVFTLSWYTLDGDVVLNIVGYGVADSGLLPGASVEANDGVVLTYVGPAAIPAIAVLDLPGTIEGETAVVQMLSDSEGGDYLFLTGVEPGGLAVGTGAVSTASNGTSFAFGGRLDASGIEVRRDPGDTFIWTAVVGALIGLAITFWIPSRRLWVKVTPGRTYFAGAAERTARLTQELDKLGNELRSKSVR